MPASNQTKQNFAPRSLLLNRQLPWMVLLVGLGITYFSQQIALSDARQALQMRFDAQTQHLLHRIEQRLGDYRQILRGTAGLFAASRSVEREEFRDYIAALRLHEHHIGIQGIGYAQLVPGRDLARHVTAIRQEGFPNFALNPPGERTLYSSIIFVEPFDERNRLAFGYDMLTEPTRSAAMEHARNNGQPAMSGKLHLVQDNGQKDQAGFLMYLPIYLNGSPGDTVEERRTNTQGWVYAAFRMNDVMRDLLDQQALEMDIEIFDGPAATPESLMYDSDGQLSLNALEQGQYVATRTLRIDGHDWTIRQTSQPYFEAQLDTGRTSNIRIAGTLCSILLALLLWGQVYSRERAISLARKIADDYQESENRWKFAIEGSGDGLWDWDIPAQKVHFSSRWKEMLGFAENEIGEELSEWSKRIHPDDTEATLATLDDYFNGKAPQYISEHRVLCKDGSWKWILDRGMVVSHDPEGAPLRMIGTHTDITREKEAVLALEASKLAAETASKLLIESINSIDQGFTVFDEEDRLLICNETYRRTYETSRDLLVPGTRFEDILRHGIARGQYPSALNDVEGWLKERLRQHREAHGQQIEQRLDDGRWLLITEQRTPSGYIAGNRIDITERKQVEIELENHRNHLQELVEERTAEAIRAKEAAEAANRAKSTFLTNISHELRTPMHAILSFGGLGLQKSSGDKVPVDKLHTYFEHIVDSASRLMVLINDLLDLSKLEAGKTSFEMRPGDPGQIIDEAVREVDVLLRQKKIRLEKQAMPAGVMLECDPFKIGQVMRNVLSNAIKFSPAGSVISLSAELSELPGRRRGDAPRPALAIAIRDQGVGIPPDELEAVFDEFIQSSKTRTGAGGTGLGLAICREILDAHTGSITASNNPDIGACICFVLPLEQPKTLPDEVA